MNVIDYFCDNLINSVEDLRQKCKSLDRCDIAEFDQSAVRKNQDLAEAIRRAITDLDATKNSFKSKQIKKIKENLLQTLDS